jgi:hypothetical protein
LSDSGLPWQAVEIPPCSAFIAVVRAHVLVARMADQHRTGNQLERTPAAAATEAALAHVRKRKAVVQLDERRIVWAESAAVVEYRDRTALQDCRRSHRCLRGAAQTSAFS